MSRCFLPPNRYEGITVAGSHVQPEGPNITWWRDGAPDPPTLSPGGLTLQFMWLQQLSRVKSTSVALVTRRLMDFTPQQSCYLLTHPQNTSVNELQQLTPKNPFIPTNWLHLHIKIWGKIRYMYTTAQPAYHCNLFHFIFYSVLFYSSILTSALFYVFCLWFFCTFTCVFLFFSQPEPEV